MEVVEKETNQEERDPATKTLLNSNPTLIYLDSVYEDEDHMRIRCCIVDLNSPFYLYFKRSISYLMLNIRKSLNTLVISVEQRRIFMNKHKKKSRACEYHNPIVRY